MWKNSVGIKDFGCIWGDLSNDGSIWKGAGYFAVSFKYFIHEMIREGHQDSAARPAQTENAEMPCKED
jgi:hypothetical protein